MTRKENLIALRDAVVKVQDAPEIYGLCDDCFAPENRGFVLHAYTGSLDAALAFVAEVLLGWAIEMTYRPFGVKPHQWFVVMTTDYTGWGNGKRVSAHADTPASALLIAALNALIEETQE